MTREKQRCIEVEELSAYLDEDLEKPLLAQVAAHLDTCASCRQNAAILRELQGSLNQCRSERPSRDLWPGIDERLGAPKGRLSAIGPRLRRLSPVVPAVAAAAAVLLLWFWQQPAPQSPANSDSQDVDRAFLSVQQAEIAYREAIVSLEKVLKNEQTSMDPQTLKIAEKSLRDIDQAIDRYRATMLKDPNNLAAHQAMLTAYREKMDFLFELVGSRIRP